MSGRTWGVIAAVIGAVGAVVAAVAANQIGGESIWPWQVAMAVIAVVATGLAAWLTLASAKEVEPPSSETEDLESTPGDVSASGSHGQAIGEVRGLNIGPGATLNHPTFNMGRREDERFGSGPARAVERDADPPAARVVGEVPQEPPAFQARPDLVERLTDAGGGSGVSVVVAVTGLRGVGKTQLAAAVARARINAGWRLVAWVDAEHVESAVSRLGEVAAVLGLEVSSGVEAALAVRYFLEVDGERCLLVLDNVTDVDGVRRFLPAAGSAQVVVTSTSQAVEVLGRRVAVEEFMPEEAVDYLVERTGRDDREGAAALAEVLGWLPLALAQAAAVIAGQRLSYDRYVERLESVRIAEALRPVAGDGYSLSTAQAIVLSVKGLTDPDGLARAVLELISMLAPIGVQRGWLYRAAELGLLTPHTGQDRVPAETVDDVLGRLAELSLVTISETASPRTGGERVVVHRLVMRVVREQATQDDRSRWTSTAGIRLLTDQLTPVEAAWQDPVGVEELVQQITALTDHLSPETWHANPPDQESTTSALYLRAQAQWYLNYQGAFRTRAISFGQHLTADYARVLGEDHPKTLNSRNTLGSAYRMAGDLGHALSLHEQNLTDRQRVLGQDHPDTLTP